MDNILRLSDLERQELFSATANRMGLNNAIVEKDYWVCFLLKHLFNDSIFKNAFVFKGGTSLSKSYHIIHRFSEDIDLILDWRQIDYKNNEPWLQRSKNQQDKFNKKMNEDAFIFFKKELVPTLNNEIKKKTGLSYLFQIDEYNHEIIKFVYPVVFEDSYLRSYVQLEIGPLAEWTPSHKTTITPFCAEYYPSLFTTPETDVLTVDVERTFWEKITILHKICNLPDSKPLPKRYARHLYDVYCMANSDIKNKAFDRKSLLEQDVAFKEKFYYSKNAHYETANIENIKLVPNQRILIQLENDYKAMKNMIYSNAPDFSTLIKFLTNLESEIHHL